MILTELRNYLKQHGEGSLEQLAIHFDVSPESLSGMLEFLEKKSVVQKIAAGGCSGTCHCDQKSSKIYYRWVNTNDTIRISSTPFPRIEVHR